MPHFTEKIQFREDPDNTTEPKIIIFIYDRMYELMVIIKMAKRVTIMIDDDNNKKLRNKQSEIIRNQGRSYSFSQAVNDTLRKNLK